MWVIGEGYTHGRNTKVISTKYGAAAAKSLQSCPTLCDPIDSSPPGSAVLGFSRQEHWSGLPFPSPMHESEKWKWSRSVVSDSMRPHGLQPTRLLHPWDFPGKSTGVGCHCLLRREMLEVAKMTPLLRPCPVSLVTTDGVCVHFLLPASPGIPHSYQSILERLAGSWGSCLWS